MRSVHDISNYCKDFQITLIKSNSMVGVANLPKWVCPHKVAAITDMLPCTITVGGRFAMRERERETCVNFG